MIKKTVLLVSALIASMSFAADISVGVFLPGKTDSPIVQAVASTKGFTAFPLREISEDSLAKCDVVVFTAFTTFSRKMAGVAQNNNIGSAGIQILRDWVETSGKGIIAFHNAAGLTRKNKESLFPEIGYGVMNFYPDHAAHAREGVVTRRHPAFLSMQPGERFVVSYFDIVTMVPGEKGQVIARQMNQIGTAGARVGEPFVIAGEAGKGRYIGAGNHIGHYGAYGLPIALAGREKLFLLNSLRWLTHDDSMPRQPGSVVDAADAQDASIGTTEVLENGEMLGKRNLFTPLFWDGKKLAPQGEQGVLVKGDMVYTITFNAETDALAFSLACTLYTIKQEMTVAAVTPATFDVVKQGRNTYEATFQTVGDTAYAALEFKADGKLVIQDIQLEEHRAISIIEGLDKRVVRERDVKWDRAKSPAPQLTVHPYESKVPLTEAFINNTYERNPSMWTRVDLQGQWKNFMDFESDFTNETDLAKGYWKKDFDDSTWDDQVVPGSWNSRTGAANGSDRKFPRSENLLGWYRTRFDLPQLAPAQRVLLTFEGIKLSSTVWVNGKRIGGRPSGPYYTIDVTDGVVPGQNVLAIRIFDPVKFPHFSREIRSGLYGRVLLDITEADIYTEKLKLATDYKTSEVSLDLSIENTGKARTAVISAAVTADPNVFATGNKKYKQTIKLGKVQLQNGSNPAQFKFKMNNPVLWNCQNPFLYVVELKSDGKVIAKQRFGMRTFVAEGQELLLNGKGLFLNSLYFTAGHMSGYHSDFTHPAGKRYKHTKAQLEAYRNMNVNNIYTHAILAPDIFDLCDELGLTVYFEPGDFNAIPPVSRIPCSGDWIYAYHNNPSICMWSFTGELQDHHFGYNAGPSVKAWYTWMKEQDLQGRPVCSSSGRADYPSTDGSEMTDLWDFHAYPGQIQGSWTEEKTLCEERKAKMLQYFKGEKDIPLIQFETGGASRNWNEDDTTLRGLGFQSDADWDKSQFIKLAKFFAPQRFSYSFYDRCGLRWCSAVWGQRVWMEDIEKGNQNGVFQQIGMLRDFNGLARVDPFLRGLCHNCDVYSLYEVSYGKGGIAKRMRATGIPAFVMVEENGSKVRYEPNYGELLATPAYDSMRRTGSPALFAMVPYDRNLFAGRVFTAPGCIVNTLPRTIQDVVARVVFKDNTGKILADYQASSGTIENNIRLRIPVTIPLPTVKTGLYDMEIFLIENGKVLSENIYPVTIFDDKFFLKELETNKKVALYDKGAAVYQGNWKTTQDILDTLKLPYTKIDDFKTLTAFDVLIVGAETPVLHDNGINAWIARGGRLLQFEHSRTGTIPFLPELNIVQNFPSVMSEVITLSHPAIKDMNAHNFRYWKGNAPLVGDRMPCAVMNCIIKPLNTTMVLTAGNDVARNSNDIIGMTLSDVKIGKGIAVLNMLEATSRYGEDAAATKYVQNLLQYILSDDMQYATEIAQATIPKVNPYGCGLVPLADQDNKRVELSGIFFDVPKTPVSVVAPYQIPFLKNVFYDPEYEAKHESTFRDEKGLSHAMVQTFFIAHRAKEGKSGETIGTYRLHFDDGSFTDHALVVGKNIGLNNQSIYEYGAFTLTLWENPFRNKTITSMEAIPEQGKRFEIFGITAELVRERLHY